MKKILSLLLLATMALTGWAGETFESGNYIYEILTAPTSSSYGTVQVAAFTTSAKALSRVIVSIPYVVTNGNNSYYVKRIGGAAFKNQTNVTSVDLPYGLEDVYSSAFENCTSLATVRIPSSVRYLRSKAFAGCSALTSVYYAGKYSDFYSTKEDCFSASSTRTLYYAHTSTPNGLRSVAAFSTSAFPNLKVSSNAYDIYMSDGALSVVTGPKYSDDNECTIVGFSYNAVNKGTLAPTSYRFKPNGQDRYFKYVAVADSAFAGNTDLVSIDMSNVNTITSYGYYFARGCTALKSATLASGSLSMYAFANCTALTSVKLDGVTAINISAFYNCTALTSINIPASVTSVNPTFCNGCTSLSRITVDSSNSYYKMYNGILYTADYNTLVRMPPASTSTSVFVRPGCTAIGQSAFNGAVNLSTIRATYGVESIGSFAFSGCTGLKSVFLTSTVSSIANYAFSSCTGLTDVYVNNPTAPTIDASYVFYNATMPNLHVRRSMEDLYKTAGWTGFKSYNKDEVVANDFSDSNGAAYTVTSTYRNASYVNGAYYDGRVMVVRGPNHALVTGNHLIPATVTSNGKTFAVTRIDTLAYSTKNSFYVTGCANVDTVCYQAFDSQPITSVTLPYVSVIDQEAFDGCTSLTNVKWGYRLRRIEKWGFCDVPMTNDVILPAGFEYLGYVAFYGAKSKKLLVPSTMKEYDTSCLKGMSSLDTLVINIDMFNTKVSYDLDKIPSSSKVFVPYGCVDRFKKHDDWSWFNDYYVDRVRKYAFDFCAGGIQNMSNTTHMMKILSENSEYYDGVRYYGTAGYSNNELLLKADSFKGALSETDCMVDGTSREFLMTWINNYCFYQSNVTSVDFSDMKALYAIGSNAFTESKITEIVIPEWVSYIAPYAFEKSNYLEKAVINGAIKELFTYTFLNCPNLTELDLPSTLEYMRNGVFANSPITKLTVRATTPPDVSPYGTAAKVMEDFTKANCVLYVPKGCIDAYKATTLWSGFKEYREIGEDEPEPDPAVRGDINGYGIVDITDVNAAINMVLGKLAKADAADIDGSGDVDITDVNAIINLMLGK